LESVQLLLPLVEIVFAIHEELQVVETGAELGEALSGVLLVTNEAQDKLAIRLHESDVTHPTVLACEVVQLF